MGRLSRGAGVRAAAVLAFALAAWALYGYTFGVSANHGFYLPWVLSRLDPALFRDDPAVASVGRVPTFFWLALAAVSRLAGLRPACLAGWLLGRLLFGWATMGLARRLGARLPGQLASLALALFSGELIVASPLAGDPLLHSFLDQTSLGWPLALTVFLLWWDGRKAEASLGLGLLANLNVLVASVLGAWLAVDALLESREKPRRAAAWLALAAAGAAPLAFRLALRPPRPDVALMLAVSPQTYLPSEWSLERWVRAAATFSTITFVFLRHAEHRRLLRLLASALLLWLAAAAAGSLPALGPLAGLELFRLDVAVVWLGLGAAGPLLERALSSAEAGTFSTGLGAAWGLATFFGSPFLVIWSGALISSRDRKVSAGLGAAALLYALLAQRPGADFFRLRPTPALATACLASFVVLAHVLRPARLSAAVRLAAAALPVAALAFLGLSVARARIEHPLELPTSEAEAWARSTPPGTLFVLPPNCSGFRLRSERRVYAEWTDFNMALWDRDGAEAWKRRLEGLGVDWARIPSWRAAQQRAWDLSVLEGRPVAEEPAVRWTPEDAPRLGALAREAGAPYLVAPTSSRLPLPVAFEGGGLTVHAVPE